MREILIVNSSLVALVDDDDFEMISRRAWYLKPNGYAMAPFARAVGGRDFRSMHRVILGVPRGEHVDHVDRNRLNNQRANLRVATQTQNLGNQVARDHTSWFKGVYWQKRGSGGWVATIRIDKKTYYLGTFAREIEAAFAYDDAAARAFGSFARLNFPSNSAVRRLGHPHEDVVDFGSRLNAQVANA